MSTDYTSTALISSVKRRASVPTQQSLFDETAFLEFLSDEMLSNLVPMVMNVREEYFVHKSDYTLVSGTDEYVIPRRAIGGKLKNVVFVDTNGHEMPVERIGYKELERDESIETGRLYGVLIRDNFIRVYPDAATFVPFLLRMYYYRRPSRIVKESEAGQITNIVGSVVTLDNAPTTWTTATVFDVIKGKPGFESLGDDLTINTKAGFDLTFDSLPATAEVGDWIAEAGESPIPQIPYELHPTLAQEGAAKIMEALGHTAGLQAAQAKLQIQEKNAMALLSPRIDDKPKRLISRKGLWRTGGSLWRK